MEKYLNEGRPKDEIYAKLAEYQFKSAKVIQEYKEKNQATVEEGQVNYGNIFIIGDKDSAAIHSEPHIDSDRLFISVVTGSKEQIHEHYENQKKHDSNLGK
ncbi:MAG: hypothetical protein H0U73_13690 [Tatlockia sp.]|nr:hypothetical protein [Tatlockia sp.]